MALHLTTRLLVLVFAILISVTKEDRIHFSRPNIVLLLADDMGYGDLGCYGNENVSTPHIDALARDGLRFTRMYSQPVCSPTRASILTGRHPIRYGILKDGSALLPHQKYRVFSGLAQPGGIPTSEKPVLSDMLESLKYKLAFIGKWHLGFGRGGIHLPMNYGFHWFYGTPGTHFVPCTGGHRFKVTDNDIFWTILEKYVSSIACLFLCVIGLWHIKLFGNATLLVFLLSPIATLLFLRYYLSFTEYSPKSCILMENNTILEQPYKDVNIAPRMTKKALEFISVSSENKEAFFLFMSYLQPHHPPVVSSWFRNRSGQGNYYDSVMELDWSVGAIVKKLKDLNIFENTLMIFASDNGPEFACPATGVPHGPKAMGSSGFIRISNGERVSLRGHKFSVWEGGIRVPTIFSWPGVIAPGKETHALANLMDIFPTISDIVGGNVQGKLFDGKNLVPILKQPETRSPHVSMMHYCDTEGVSAVTLNRYKVHFRSCSGEVFNPPLLYDIEKDPGESNPLSLSHHEKVLSEVQSAIEHHQSTLTPVPSQVSELLRPWLFPCSNWPYCEKSIDEEEDFDDLYSEPLD